MFYLTSSLSWHAAGTDFPDPLSPLVLITHLFWYVFHATYYISRVVPAGRLTLAFFPYA